MRICNLTAAYKRYALHERGMRPRSYRSIMASLSMLREFAHTDQINALDRGTIRAFLCWGREERAWEARTFRNHCQYLKSFFAWCVQQSYLKTNPVDGIEKPKLPQRVPRCLTREDTQRILSRVRWHPWRYPFEGIRNEAILNTLVFTGLRLQEMLDLTLTDVNLDSREILVRQGKGQKDRLIPIHPRLAPILRNYLSHRADTGREGVHMFTGAQSCKPLSGKDIRTICRKIFATTGVYFTPHMLRHTFARLALEGGFDIFKIKEIMGHSDIATTQAYLSVSTENIKKTFGEIELL